MERKMYKESDTTEELSTHIYIWVNIHTNISLFCSRNAYKEWYSFRKGYRVPRSWFLYHFLIKGTRAPEKNESRFGAGNIQDRPGSSCNTIKQRNAIHTHTHTHTHAEKRRKSQLNSQGQNHEQGNKVVLKFNQSIK